MPKESRAHDRLDYRTDVRIQYGERVIDGTSRNISQGGIFVETDQSVPMGEDITVRFHLPGLKGETLETGAQVRWIEREGHPGIGVQFKGLRPIEVWAINQLFRKDRG